MPRFPAEQTLQFTMTLTELSALNRLLVHLTSSAGKLDLSAILQAANGDRDVYAEMLCALIHIKTAAQRAMAPNGDSACRMLAATALPSTPGRF